MDHSVNEQLASPAKTITVADICKLNDLSVAQAEKALANLQEKGFVTGFIPGDIDAKIIISEKAMQYFS